MSKNGPGFSVMAAWAKQSKERELAEIRERAVRQYPTLNTPDMVAESLEAEALHGVVPAHVRLKCVLAAQILRGGRGG